MLGVKVVVSPDLPKMVLSQDVPVTDEFRREIDAWMLDFFGTWNMLPDGECYTAGAVVYMNPRTFARLRAASL
ncbi:hypothetical protein [Hydrogenophaga sp. T2]|uniref:hypothetical protein n=1 Tax=Hydrogenophaga sp. T2 TaxID=3132823 RepID=UPI003CF66608